jgi:nucleoside-diphosphate-sugar epimerase
MLPVFVTGGTGYVGSVLIGELLAHGYPVHALAREGRRRRGHGRRTRAERLGLVTRDQMVSALLQAVVHPPPSGVRIIEVPIRRGS